MLRIRLPKSIETPAKLMIGSSPCLMFSSSHGLETAPVYPQDSLPLASIVKACSLNMCRLVLGLWIFAPLLAPGADISEADKMKLSAQIPKIHGTPLVLPLLLTQSFSIGSFTASKEHWFNGWHLIFL